MSPAGVPARISNGCIEKDSPDEFAHADDNSNKERMRVGPRRDAALLVWASSSQWASLPATRGGRPNAVGACPAVIPLPASLTRIGYEKAAPSDVLHSVGGRHGDAGLHPAPSPAGVRI
jgi:hypothetical protein